MRRPTPISILLLLGLLGCTSNPFGGMSQEERAQIEGFAERAEKYVQSNRIDQAESQIQQGLALDPDHYYLNLYLGRVQNLKAEREAEWYQVAVETLERVADMRSRSEQDYRVYLWLGNAWQGLATCHRKEAEFLARRALDVGVDLDRAKELQEKVAEQKQLYRESLDKARKAYADLAATGESPIQAERFLFQVEAMSVDGLEGEQRKEHIEAAVARGEKFLAEVRKRHQVYEDQARRSLDADVEEESRIRRNEYRRREIDTRGLLASLYERLGRIDEAIAQLDGALALDDKDTGALYHRGRLRAEAGRKPGAKQDLTEFLRLTRLPFEAEQVKRARELLREL
ncbi:MAG: tetratricopeptide repeat protein [Planctomycetota bacterium]